MWHIRSLLRCKVGWDSVVFWFQKCQWLLLRLLKFLESSLQVALMYAQKKIGEEILG